MTVRVDGGTAPRMRNLPVAGGTLRVAEWGPDDDGTPTVLAVHGITASHKAWAPVARALAEVHPGVRLVAPDLRGRGRSAALPGPWGLRRHAADLQDVLDGLGVDTCTVAGHSMGAFVAVLTAHRLPGRVRSVVLVDGGLPLVPPPGRTPQEAALATLGPAAARLSMTFANRADYQDFWRRHPALADSWSPAIADYVDYDLGGREPRLRPVTPLAALRQDAPEVFDGGPVTPVLPRLAAPASVLVAPRGLQDEPRGLYGPEDVARWHRLLPRAELSEVAGVNHYTITLTPHGAEAVAGAVNRAVLR